MGIVWLQPVNKTVSLAEAMLPEGWQATEALTEKNVTLLKDKNQIPRVHIANDKHSSPGFKIKFLHEEKSLILLEKEKSLATICEHRFTEPSEKHPYGVFFVKSKISDDGMNYYRCELRSCHGFFPTEEIAKEAEKFLKS